MKVSKRFVFAVDFSSPSKPVIAGPKLSQIRELTQQELRGLLLGMFRIWGLYMCAILRAFGKANTKTKVNPFDNYGIH